MSESPRPHVVIVGGGFGGLSAAKALRNVPVDVTLIDRTNHYLFQPLLYQVATASCRRRTSRCRFDSSSAGSETPRC
jgi:NADH dehydrogenase FAD-containing subunit